MHYSPQEQEKPYKTLRHTVESPILIEALDTIQRDKNLSDSELFHDMILEYLEGQQMIERNTE